MKLIVKYSIVLFLLPILVTAQYSAISGLVKDNNGNPLIGANVRLENTLIGTATDKDGMFELKNLKKDRYTLIISMIGFATFSSEVTLTENLPKLITIQLDPIVFESKQVIVTAGKHEQNLIDIPVSAALIDAEEFSRKNYKSLDKALRNTSGVSVTLDQVSIRGSSGYSRGAGSRVLVAFDGIPLNTGDSGEIIWEQIPPYEIGRVEIIKGSASSLYGSSAIGGIINVIPKSIPSNPVSFIKTYYGIYGAPSHKEWNWSGSTRNYNGLSVSHSRMINNIGLSLSLYRNEDYGYRENDYDRRIGGYFKLNYNISENTRLDIWGTGYIRERETFNFWKDINNALSPPDGDLGSNQPSNRNIIAMAFNQKFSDDFSLSVKPSMYRTYWRDESESSNYSTAYLYRGEVKTIFITGDNSVLISGIEAQSGNAVSNIFGDNNVVTFGTFSQFEFELGSPVKLTTGLRFDYSKLINLNAEYAFSPKLGINYSISESTTLRGSVGTGFRAPTLAEAFTSTTASGLTVKPNPEIKSESSLSFELGANYNATTSLILDAAIFQSEYYDLIEPILDPADANVIFSNITRAKIQGFEFNAQSDFIHNSLLLKIGYTFLYPRNVEENKDLKYRSRNQLNLSLSWQYSILNFGLDIRYLSKIAEIDYELVDFGIVKNGDKRVDIKVVDARISANLYTQGIPVRLFLNANNLLNYNYVEMIGNVAPIRNFSLSAELLF